MRTRVCVSERVSEWFKGRREFNTVVFSYSHSLRVLLCVPSVITLLEGLSAADPTKFN